MDKFGRRFTFVYLQILHTILMAVIGLLGFADAGGVAGWFLAM